MTMIRKAAAVCLAAVMIFNWAPASAQPQPQPQPSPRPQTQSAQGAAPVVPAVPVEPNATTAAFGDWVLRCARQGEGAQVQRVCEVAQTVQVQGQQGPLAQVAIGRLQKAAPLKMTVILPSNVSFPSSVSVGGDEKDRSNIDLPWRRCVPGACIADGEPAAAALQQLRARTEPGRVAFKDAGGRDVAVPLSLRGLPQALDALARE